jgi:hypothetical protein
VQFSMHALSVSIVSLVGFAIAYVLSFSSERLLNPPSRPCMAT